MANLIKKPENNINVESGQPKQPKIAPHSPDDIREQGMTTRTSNALKRGLGSTPVHTTKDLQSRSNDSLLKIRGVGPKSIKEVDPVREKIMKQGFAPKKNNQKIEALPKNSDNSLKVPKKHTVYLSPYRGFDDAEPTEYNSEDDVYNAIFDYSQKNNHHGWAKYNGLEIPLDTATLDKPFNPKTGYYDSRYNVDNLKKWVDEYGYTKEYKPHVPGKNVLYYYDPREEMRKWAKENKGADDSMSIEDEGYYYPQWLESKKHLKNLHDLEEWREEMNGSYFDDDPWLKGIDRYINERKAKKNNVNNNK